jgi:hypothetical protein
MAVPTFDPTAITSKKRELPRSTEKLWPQLYLAKPTNIVGRLMAKERLPASGLCGFRVPAANC